MNKKKPRLYNKEITAYYIHWASKITTSANKHADKIIYKTDSTSIEFKKG